jgi:hypothetical protein
VVVNGNEDGAAMMYKIAKGAGKRQCARNPPQLFKDKGQIEK